MHSNGDMSKNHYDMNLVFVDGLMRHLLSTGDTAYAREVWPVIERHLAWRRRLFRRPYGPDKLPLYEAYNVIWASDNLQYVAEERFFFFVPVRVQRIAAVLLAGSRRTSHRHRVRTTMSQAPELDLTIKEAAQNFTPDPHHHPHLESRGAPPLIDDDLGIGD